MPLTLNAKLDLTTTDPNLGEIFDRGSNPEDEYLYGSLGGNYREYLQMRRDSRIRALLNKRRQSLLGRRVIVEPGSKKLKDQVGVDIANEVLKRIRYESLCSALLNTGQLIGFAVLRVDWHEVEGYVIPKWRFVPQNRFVFAHPTDRDIPVATDERLDPKTEIILVQEYELRLLTRRSPFYGERCPKNRFIVYTFDGDSSPWGLGLGYSLYPWRIVKREATKNWLMHGDRLGSPPVIGTHPPDMKSTNPVHAPILAQFENFLKSVSPNGWARLPLGFEARVLDALGGAGADVHQSLIYAADAQMSVTVLGEMAYSDKLTGSYAANASQVDDRDSNLIDADVNILDEQLDDQLWRPIAEYNYPNLARPIVRRETMADARQQSLETEKQASSATQVNRDTTLISWGLKPSEEYVQENYGSQWSFPKEPQAAAPNGQPPNNQITMSEPLEFANNAIRYLYWNDLTIGVEFEVGQIRFDKPMQVIYGYISRHVGADGDALDCYVGSYLSSPRIFRVIQLDREGRFDEYKYMLCFDTIQRAELAYKAHVPRDRFGGIEETSWVALRDHYRPRDPVTPPPEQLDDSNDYADYSGINFKIPAKVIANAKRALKLREQFGRGGTDVGLNTARILAAGGSISPAKLRHINLYFPRHEVDKQGENWGNADNPSNGFIAWLLWGGDEAWKWSNRLVAAMDKAES